MGNYVVYDTENKVYVSHMSRNPGYASADNYQLEFSSSIDQAQLWDNQETARMRCKALNDNGMLCCIVQVKIVRDER